ncbi:MAG: glucose-6-phosphate isomerase [Clostridia bacterium]|nr:glucose-6-phosphate isomerase [Clostridia bacterium]
MEEFKLSLTDRSGNLTEAEIAAEMAVHAGLLERVKKGETEYRESLGWLDVSVWGGEPWISRYESLAREVQAQADVLVVIGIGGSNQAARAVAEAIGEKSGVRLVWAGNSISAYEIGEVIRQIRGKRVYIDVIAKNFETLEPGIGFRALRAFLKEQYGEDYRRHVICTGTEGASLHALCEKHGYTFLPFPQEIGGRFTALSPVGLFPLAAAGMDIRALVQGAQAMRDRLMREEGKENTALRYAAVRNLLYRKGYRMEMLSFFEPRFFRFAKWWMQLFGESEGKDNLGLYPLFGNFSEDLHSIGQFLQEGTPVIFETFLEARRSGASLMLRDDDVEDGFEYLNGKDFDEVNRVACAATMQAHAERFPCLQISVDAMDETAFGQLFYFFFFSCYLSARMLGVNPFNQPGVEAYKVNMFRFLGKTK